eukprot:544526-Pyramimonas_sp.AAC.1
MKEASKLQASRQAECPNLHWVAQRLRKAHRDGRASVLENPRSSVILKQSPLKSIASLGTFGHLDQCQLGAADPSTGVTIKKPTFLHMINITLQRALH